MIQNKQLKNHTVVNLPEANTVSRPKISNLTQAQRRPAAFKKSRRPPPPLHQKQYAFHNAGHLVAIYVNDGNERLNRSYFHIKLDDFNSNETDSVHQVIRNGHRNMAYSNAGCSMQSIAAAVEDASPSYADACRENKSLLEAEIISLLAGPLAEARYIHDEDNEPMTHYLVDLEALKSYGGYDDLILVQENLNALSQDPSERERKLAELFKTAFDFIVNELNWKVVSQLAESLYRKKSMSYGEVVAMFEANQHTLE